MPLASQAAGNESQRENRASGENDDRAAGQVQEIREEQSGQDGELGDQDGPPGQRLERAAEQADGGDRDDQKNLWEPLGSRLNGLLPKSNKF